MLKLATWNVRTMCPGLSDDLQKIDDTRKTAIIDRELKRPNIDIAGLQETRLPVTAVSRRETTPSSGRGRKHMNTDSTVSDLPSATPSYKPLKHHPQAHQESSPFVSPHLLDQPQFLAPMPPHSAFQLRLRTCSKRNWRQRYSRPLQRSIYSYSATSMPEWEQITPPGPDAWAILVLGS